jgi:hypothetical protein
MCGTRRICHNAKAVHVFPLVMAGPRGQRHFLLCGTLPAFLVPSQVSTLLLNILTVLPSASSRSSLQRPFPFCTAALTWNGQTCFPLVLCTVLSQQFTPAEQLSLGPCPCLVLVSSAAWSASPRATLCSYLHLCFWTMSLAWTPSPSLQRQAWQSPGRCSSVTRKKTSRGLFQGLEVQPPRQTERAQLQVGSVPLPVLWGHTLLLFPRKHEMQDVMGTSKLPNRACGVGSGLHSTIQFYRSFWSPKISLHFSRARWCV